MTDLTLPSVLLVDDELEERAALAAALSQSGFDVRCVDDDRQASPEDVAPVDVIVSKLVLRGNGAGPRLVRAWRRLRPQVPVVAIAGRNQLDPAAQAMSLGAADCISSPIDPQKLASSLRRVLSLGRNARNGDTHGRLPRESDRFHGIIGRSPRMRAVFDQVEHVAPTGSTVLITGATGTGKELLANAIHTLSRRRTEPFVAVNVAAVPYTLVESELFGHEKGAFTDAATERIGRFEAANGGTLFVDEIGDLQLQSQSKLLRVLETRLINRVGSNKDIPVDVRVVAATSRNLERMVADGQFREDLYYRLNVVRIILPELSHRRDDIPLLVEYFLTDFARQHDTSPQEFSPELMDFLSGHAWPGNVRQLRNCLESMLVMSGVGPLTMDDLPPSVHAPGREEGVAELPLAGCRLDHLEERAICQTLQRFEGNRTRAAKSLGISVRTLQRKIKRIHPLIPN